MTQPHDKTVAGVSSYIFFVGIVLFSLSSLLDLKTICLLHESILLLTSLCTRLIMLFEALLSKLCPATCLL